MSDQEIGEELPAHGLNAIAAFKHGDGYALALVDDDGATHAYTVSDAKLRQVFVIIGRALEGLPSGTANVMREMGYG